MKINHYSYCINFVDLVGPQDSYSCIPKSLAHINQHILATVLDEKGDVVAPIFGKGVVGCILAGGAVFGG